MDGDLTVHEGELVDDVAAELERIDGRAADRLGDAVHSNVDRSPNVDDVLEVARRQGLASARRNDTTQCRNPPSTSSCNPTPSSYNATIAHRDRRPRWSRPPSKATATGPFDPRSHIRALHHMLHTPARQTAHARHSSRNGTLASQSADAVGQPIKPLADQEKLTLYLWWRPTPRRRADPSPYPLLAPTNDET
jgi:hypothetical protein